MVVSGDAEFAPGRENGKGSDNKLQEGNVETRVLRAGRRGEVIAISGSTTTGDTDPVCLKTFSCESTATGIRDWR